MGKDSGADPALAKAEPSRLGPSGFDPGDMRALVIGRCWNPTPGNIYLAIKNQRDWFEREVKRLEAIMVIEQEKVRTITTVIRYFEQEAA